MTLVVAMRWTVTLTFSSTNARKPAECFRDERRDKRDGTILTFIDFGFFNDFLAFVLLPELDNFGSGV